MNETTTRLADHLSQVFFGGNWTCSNVKDQLSYISHKDAVAKIGEHNSILELSYHILYYVRAQGQYLKEGVLDAHDNRSFLAPMINTEQEWLDFKKTMLEDVTELVELIKALSDKQLNEFFVEEKYGTYYRNFQGLIEHTHYHLGQIALLKKLLKS